MEKSPDAFRTISEVAEALDTPAHVLRFWETRFSQIRPIKRAGGRRYYRPSDVALLGGIKKLLHDDGLTIRGVQKLLREQGIRHVAAFAEDGATEVEDVEAPMSVDVPAEPETRSNVVAMPGNAVPQRPAKPAFLPEAAPAAPAPEKPAAPRVEAAPAKPAEVSAPEEAPARPALSDLPPSIQPSVPEVPLAPEPEPAATALRRMTGPLPADQRATLSALHARLSDLRARMAGAARSQGR